MNRNDTTLPATQQGSTVWSEQDNFRSLFAQVPEMVCILTGPEHLFEFVNEAHVKVLGFNATGKTVREAQPESVEAHILLDRVYSTGQTAHLHEIPITVGRSLRFFNLTYAARRDTDGNPNGVMVLGIEVTDQVVQGRAFTRQREALEKALNGSPLPEVLEVIVKMVENQLENTLRASILLLDSQQRLRHGAARGLPDAYNEIVDGLEIAPDRGSCGTAAFTKKPEIVSDIPTDPRWALFKDVAAQFHLKACWSFPVLSSQDKVLGTLAVYSEKTQSPTPHEMQLLQIGAQTTALILERQLEYEERIARTREFKDSEERLHLALHSGKTGLWDWNARTGFVYLSDTLMKQWGIDPATFKNTLPECLDHIHVKDRDRVWSEIQISTFEERPYDIDYRVVKPGGEIVWINAKGRFYLDENQQPERLTGITVDITERRRIASDLETAKEEAEKANHLKSAFLANMSHEIRTPLGAMIGFAELLGDPGASPAEKANYIDILRKNGEQLSHVINDILDLSKVETGHINFEYLEVSPLQIAHEVVSLMSVIAKEKGLVLSFEDDGTTPNSVITDPTRMKQVLMNLVSNALKFTKVGSITISLSGFEGKNGEKCCAFEVRDTGVGIPEESVDRLFKVFSQADNSMTRKYGGTGLGLALSRSLARAMGGNVRLVKTQSNLGSTFHFSIESREDLLPAVREAQRNDQKPQSEELPLDALEGVRVLLIEDSPDNQQLIWRYLSRYGAHIEIADNGAEGVRKALASEHDVVLCDLQMPVMDGYTAVGKLRGRGYQTPIIALTAHAMADVRKKCQDVGCTDHLPKPINSKDLVAAVKRYSTKH